MVVHVTPEDRPAEWADWSVQDLIEHQRRLRTLAKECEERREYAAAAECYATLTVLSLRLDPVLDPVGATHAAVGLAGLWFEMHLV